MNVGVDESRKEIFAMKVVPAARRGGGARRNDVHDASIADDHGPILERIRRHTIDEIRVREDEFLRGRVKGALGILDAHLGKSAFAVGDQPSIADISMCGYLYWPDEFGVSWTDYPRIGAWLERIRKLPGWVHPYELMPGHPLKR